MKKFAKICGIAAGCLILMGVGCLLAAYAMGARFSTFYSALDKGFYTIEGHGSSVELDDREDMEESMDHLKEGESAAFGPYEDIKNIDVEVNIGSIVLKSTKEDKISVEDSEKFVDDKATEIYQKDHTLYLKNEFSIKTKYEGDIIIYIPENMSLDSVTMDLDAGEVVVENDLSVDSLEVQIGAGMYTSKGVITAQESDWEVGAGQISVHKLDSQDISVECGVGEIEASLTGSEKEYNYQVECGLGNIKLGSQNFTSLSDQAVKDEENISKEIEANCGMGTITISFEN